MRTRDRRLVAALGLTVVAASLTLFAAWKPAAPRVSQPERGVRARGVQRLAAAPTTERVSFRRGANANALASSAVHPKRLATRTPVVSKRTDADTLVVHARRNATRAEVIAELRAAGGHALHQLASLPWWVISTAGRDRQKVIAALGESSAVAAVEPNHLRYASVSPDDEGYTDQGHLLVSRLPLAWEVTRGSPSVDVAILDTGIDMDHPDLDGHLVAGHDFANNDEDASDDVGHGTMVAGIVAAETNNTIGVAGVAWNARLMPVKVLGADGSGSDATVSDGIVWAADHGAEIINLSLGGPGESSLLADAVAYAAAHGVVVVAAAGNESSGEPSYPAAIPAVVSVGATDLAGDATDFTNYGPWVDLTAPGADIVSTALLAGPGGAYAVADGTSFAAPIVSGVAALVRAKNPTWSAAQIGSRLISTAADRGPGGIDDFYGHGLVDAYAAVGGRTAMSPPPPMGDSLEPNDVLARATPVTASTAATIAPEGDVDWYSVETTTPGSIKFRVVTPSTAGTLGFDPVISAFSPDVRELGSADRRPVGQDETLAVPAAAAGRYYFRVANAGPSQSPASYGVTAATSSEPMEFAPYEPISVTPRAAEVAIADVTGDGRSDMVVTTTYGWTIDDTSYRLWVFPQLPDGSLGEPKSYATNGGFRLATGDLDGDGKLDVAVGRSGGIDLFHQVDGNLVGPTSVVADGSNLTIGDITGDGVADIVAQESGDTLSTIVLERSGTDWAPTVTGLPFVYDPELGDVTGDGRPDIVGLQGYASSEMRVLVSQPDGTFALQTHVGSFGSSGNFKDAAIGDVNGDHRSDVVATVAANAPNARLNVFAQDASGTLQPALSVASSDVPQTVKAADTNGDGLTDLVTVHGSGGQLGIYRQQSDGTLGPEKLFEAPYTPPRYGQRTLDVGDISGDGLADIAMADDSLGVLLLRQVDRDSLGGEPTWVRGSSIADFATAVGPASTPAVTFAREIDGTSVTASNVMLTDATTGSAQTASLGTQPSTRTLTVQPGAPLKAGHSYVLSVTGVRDVQGDVMSEIFRTRFTVAKPATPPSTRADVNGDGYDDVIVSAPNEDTGSARDSGVVNVLYGGPASNNLKATAGQTWSQDTPGIADVAETGDQFGAAIATGDVNNDGYDDVAIGAPGEDVGTKRDIGIVHLVLGSKAGLKATGSQAFTQDSAGIPDATESGDRFGASLAFGDFDNTAGEDLVIGSPGEAVGAAAGAGSIHVLSGRSGGVTTAGTLLVTQQSVDGTAAAGNGFGSSLAVGDFDGDTHDDLAVGAPTEDITDIDQGTVTFLSGTIVGLRPQFTLWSELITGSPGSRGERFGAALAAGDFGGLADPDGYDDLAIGTPGANGGAGRVDLVFSDWVGVGAAASTFVQTGNGNVPEAGDGFGATLAARSVRNSPTAWLAIGAPGEDIGAARDAGVVNVVRPYLSATQLLLPAGLQQGANGIPGPAETGDRFGDAVKLIDVNRDGAPDALVGVPGEGVGTAASAGLVQLVDHAQKLPKAQTLIQGKAPAAGATIPGAAEAGDRFGAKLGG